MLQWIQCDNCLQTMLKIKYAEHRMQCMNYDVKGGGPTKPPLTPARYKEQLENFYKYLSDIKNEKPDQPEPKENMGERIIIFDEE